MTERDKRNMAVGYLMSGEWCTLDQKERTRADIALSALFNHLKHAGKQVKIYPAAMNAMISQLATIIEGGSIDEYDINWDNLLIKGVAWKQDVRATARCSLALLNFFGHLSDAARITNRSSISAKWALYLLNLFDEGEGLFTGEVLDDGFILATTPSGCQVLGQRAHFLYPDFDGGYIERDTFKAVFAQFGKR
ncbi:hypothetical protein FPV16_23010 [Methylobacterium sp. W2]|uniref:hypothetical protein n=1 Tax=Methylobacterium sp. W2 TaxID=2598107 RepID=UPI001D0C2ABF|nr:hypothetical protein [Methylobacterium sp. W2]MCC0809034.1 hypothetical protein [Methylobacterium sp. W2]